MVHRSTRRLLSIALVIAGVVTTFEFVPVASAQATSHAPIGALDAVTYDEATNTVVARGWAGDQDGSSAKQRVHLYVDGKGFLAINTGRARPDVARRYPALGATTGFSVRTRAPADRGNHQVCAYAINQGGGPAAMVGCRTVYFDGTIIGHIDSAEDQFGDSSIAEGWALNPYVVSSAAKPLRVYIAGKGLGTMLVTHDVLTFTAATTGDRPDVDRHYPNNGSHHGFYWNAFAREMRGDWHSTVCIYRVVGNGTHEQFLVKETPFCASVKVVNPGP